MAKGLLCVALAACLMASAQSQIALPDIGSLLSPVTKALETVTNTIGTIVAPVTSVVSGLTNTLGGLTNTVTNLAGSVTNVAGGLVGTVTNVAGGLTGGLTGGAAGGLGGILGLVTDLVNPLLKTVTDTLTSTLGGVTKGLDIGGLTGTLGNVLQTAVGAPLNVVNQLTGSVTSILNPSNLTGGVAGALKPVLDAVTSLTNQLTGTGAVGCILNSATKSLNTIVLKVTSEIINCGIPKTTELLKIASNITSNAGKLVNATSNLVGNTTNCLQQTATSANIGGAVGCVVDPVKNTASVATNTLSQAVPIVSGALGSALQIPGCAVSAVAKAVNETTVLLKSILECALGKGVNASLPTLPNVVPNFTAIANKSISAIDGIVSAALGPKSPVKNLFDTLEKLKNITNVLTPNAVNSVNTTLNSIQEVINAAAKAANNNPAALACVSNAQKALNDLAGLAISTVVNCSVNVASNSAPLATQAAAFDIGLKTDLLKASANALTKCAVYTLSLDNSAQNCFDSSIAELEAYIKGQFDKINAAITTAQSLIDEAQKCLSNGINWTNKAGQSLVDQLNGCLGGQGINIKQENITSVVISGKANVEKAAQSLSGSVDLVSTLSQNIQGSVDFIKSIDKTTIENSVSGTTYNAQNVVNQTEAGLNNNTNPAVKACIDGIRNQLSTLEPAAISEGVNCVASNKQKAEGIAAQTAADVKSLNDKVANAGSIAQAKCSASATQAIAAKCFVDFQVNLQAEVDQAGDRVQQSSVLVQQILSDALACANDAPNKVFSRSNAGLHAFNVCLNKQGININIPCV